MTAVYPVFLDLRGRRAVVIGGDAVAEQTVRAVVAAGAHAALVGPDVTAALARRGRPGAHWVVGCDRGFGRDRLRAAGRQRGGTGADRGVDRSSPPVPLSLREGGDGLSGRSRPGRPGLDHGEGPRAAAIGRRGGVRSTRLARAPCPGTG